MIKKVFSLVKKFIIGAFLLYGYNLIAINFNLLIPINVFTVSFLTILGAPGLIGLVLFKIIVL